MMNLSFLPNNFGAVSFMILKFIKTQSNPWFTNDFGRVHKWNIMKYFYTYL